MSSVLVCERNYLLQQAHDQGMPPVDGHWDRTCPSGYILNSVKCLKDESIVGSFLEMK